MANVSIIGAGSWGTALAFLLHENGHQVTEWSAFEKEAESLRTEHRLKTLPDLVLPDDMEFTSDLERAMKGKDLLVVAVPSIYVRETARKMKPFLKEGQLVVNVAKGIEEATLMTLTDILEEELPGADVAVLSGPSHAEEVSRGLPTTCVAGARTRKTAEKIQNLFMSPVFRVYISPDILGIEIGGALKNVIALAAGIADGLGYGDNTKAALITRGVAEISRLGMAMGGKLETFAGLTGIGDLIVTCASMHSRNRRAGILIGKGYSMKEAMDEVQMVVEGVYSACLLYTSPLYFVDPVHRAVGLSHSGWRGTVHRMGKATLEAMNREYGTEPANVIACIGPSICQDCFEVGPEVAAEFADGFAKQYHNDLFYQKPDGKYQVDLWRANQIVLREAGIPADQIHTTDICTRCNPAHLFSHRIMGTERGNLAAFLALREQG